MDPGETWCHRRSSWGSLRARVVRSREGAQTRRRGCQEGRQRGQVASASCPPPCAFEIHEFRPRLRRDKGLVAQSTEDAPGVHLGGQAHSGNSGCPVQPPHSTTISCPRPRCSHPCRGRSWQRRLSYLKAAEKLPATRPGKVSPAIPASSEVAQQLQNKCPCCRDSGRSWPSIHRCWLDFVKCGRRCRPKLADVGQAWPNLAQNPSLLGRNWPSSA